MTLGACSVAVPVHGPDQRVVASLGIGVAHLGRERPQLVGALTVTGQMDKARAMLDQGRAALQGDAAELAALNDVATGAGL